MCVPTGPELCLGQSDTGVVATDLCWGGKEFDLRSVFKPPSALDFSSLGGL